MFRPNQVASLEQVIGRDVHSRETFGAAREISVAVVRLITSAQKTTVRADSSASRGSAEETVVQGIMLVDKAVAMNRGDRLTFNGIQYRIFSIHPRYTVAGALDHFQIELEIRP